MWKSTWRVDWGMFSVDIIILIECIDVSKYCFFFLYSDPFPRGEMQHRTVVSRPLMFYFKHDSQ